MADAPARADMSKSIDDHTRRLRLPFISRAVAAAMLIWSANAYAQSSPASLRTSTTPGAASLDTTMRAWPDLLHAPAVTRAELEQLHSRLVTAAARTADWEMAQRMLGNAQFIHARLTYGDFTEGEHFFLSISGPISLADTIAVRQGQIAEIPNVGEITLAGVLRSELQQHLEQEIGRYLKNAQVRSSALMRLAVLGSIAKPGYYQFPADIALSDAVMRAGGPSSVADMRRSTIARDTLLLFGGRDVANAASDGFTLDQLGLHSGDILTLGEKKTTSWLSIAQTMTYVLSIGFGIYGITRRR